MTEALYRIKWRFRQAPGEYQRASRLLVHQIWSQPVRDSRRQPLQGFNVNNGSNNKGTRVPADFDALANWFVEINARFSPSEYHGAMVGALAGGMRLQKQEWQGYLYAVMGYDPQSVGAERREEQAIQMANHADDALEGLRSDEMEFQLYLPDDDYDLGERTEAVSQWCKGFLGGFAEAQLYRKRAGFSLPEEYPENVLEAIRDLTEIARATAQQDETEIDDLEATQAFNPMLEDPSSGFDEDTYGEADEKDYLEISEYVRLAALTVFTEYGWVEVHEKSPAAGTGDRDKPVLH